MADTGSVKRTKPTLTQRIAALEAQLAAYTALTAPPPPQLYTAANTTAPPPPVPPPLAEKMAATSAHLKEIAAARAVMQKERTQMKAAGLIHPSDVPGAILAGAEPTNFVQIGRNQFGNPMIHVEPLDAPIIVTRNTQGVPQGRYYLANGLAVMSEAHDEWSCQGALFVEMQSTDHPNANVGRLTAMDAAVYVKIENRGKVAGFAYHTDTWCHGDGTTISFNAEDKRTNPGGTVIAFNAQSDVDSAPYPSDYAFHANGPWKKAFHRVGPGSVLSVGDLDYLTVRDDGAAIWGSHVDPVTKELIGSFATDAAGNLYAGKFIAPGVRAFMVIDGVPYINGRAISL